MNSTIGRGDPLTSSITDFSRFSNSPRTPAPACSRPMSSSSSSTSRSGEGTSPAAIASASPSTSAVFPTPGSPTMIGLFLRRRARISVSWRISAWRPKIGSILPARAFSVYELVKRRSAESDPPAGVALPPFAPTAPVADFCVASRVPAVIVSSSRRSTSIGSAFSSGKLSAQ